MAKIPYVQKENASPEIRALYEQVEGKLGLVPNVVKAMANSPALLQGFMPFLKKSRKTFPRVTNRSGSCEITSTIHKLQSLPWS